MFYADKEKFIISLFIFKYYIKLYFIYNAEKYFIKSHFSQIIIINTNYLNTGEKI